MNFSRPEHIAITENRDSTCIKCLTDKDTAIRLTIEDMDYGSTFEHYDINIVLCNHCYEQSKKEIWSDEKIVAFHDVGLDFHELKYENEILEYIEHCPLAGQELIWNTGVWTCDSQTWIDEELDRQTERKLHELQSQHTRNIEVNNSPLRA